MNVLRLSQRGKLLAALLLLVLAGFQTDRYLDDRRDMLASRSALLPSAMQICSGVTVSLLYSAENSEGSWISMTMDPQGRLIVSPNEQKFLLRLTVSGGEVRKVEQLSQPVGLAMGLLYAEGSLYLDSEGPRGWGIYRMFDNEGVYGEPELLRPLKMSMYEHGPHAIVLGPDKKLYVVCGDHTELPKDVSPASPFQNYADDQLLSRDEDPLGMGLKNLPPAGFVLRMDLDGKNCELFAGGSRNTYDVAFNSDGELFGFDSDAEYDFGLPWYRPIRINHWVSGGDYGYRQGSGKFPEYYEDTLPATLNVGIGSPTGVKFAPANCPYPPPYRNACFMEDWTYGRLFAVHFVPRGATYAATIETVLRGTPLNLTAMQFGLDGTLYFITGGHGAISGLYRLTCTRRPAPALQLALDKGAGPARELRRKLESWQGRRDPGAIDFLWPSLSSEDRWIRYAARVALEFQDVSLWKDRALAETNIDGGLTALLALARCGGRQTQPGLLRALEKFPSSGMTEEQTLLKLRVMELSFIRQGRPADDLVREVSAALDPLYPSASDNVNHELCQLLLFLNAPHAVTKTLALLEKAPTQEEQIYYIMRLRNVTNGWTLAQRKDYLGWFLQDHSHAGHPHALLEYFKDAGRSYYDGNRLDMYLDNFRQETRGTLSAGDIPALAGYLRPIRTTASLPAPVRKFVKEWRMQDLLPDMSNLKSRRHLARGRLMFVEAQCYVCHHFGNEGGSFGPDLTAVGSRMAPRDILEAMLDPSKVIVEQYRNTLLTLKDGDVMSGRVIDEDEKKLLVMTGPMNPTSVSVSKTDIVARRLSNISPMPEGLVNSMTEEEIWDLVAFLKTGPRNMATVSVK